MGRGNASKVLRKSERYKKKKGGRAAMFAATPGRRNLYDTAHIIYKGILYSVIMNEQGVPEYIHKSQAGSHGIQLMGQIKENYNPVLDIELRNEVIREYYKKTMK
jgi:hypothetical protein